MFAFRLRTTATRDSEETQNLREFYLEIYRFFFCLAYIDIRYVAWLQSKQEGEIVVMDTLHHVGNLRT